MPPAAAACNMAIHCSALGATWPQSTTISVSTSTPSCRCMVSSSSGCRSKDNTKCAPDAARPRRRGDRIRAALLRLLTAVSGTSPTSEDVRLESAKSAEADFDQACCGVVSNVCCDVSRSALPSEISARTRWPLLPRAGGANERKPRMCRGFKSTEGQRGAGDGSRSLQSRFNRPFEHPQMG
jgi:hypothetical protein